MPDYSLSPSTDVKVYSQASENPGDPEADCFTVGSAAGTMELWALSGKCQVSHQSPPGQRETGLYLTFHLQVGDLSGLGDGC